MIAGYLVGRGNTSDQGDTSTYSDIYLDPRCVKYKGHYRAPPRPQWGRSIHVTPQQNSLYYPSIDFSSVKGVVWGAQVAAAGICLEIMLTVQTTFRITPARCQHVVSTLSAHFQHVIHTQVTATLSIHPTLYKEAAQIKRQIKWTDTMKTDSVLPRAFRKNLRLFSILDSEFFRTRLDRPKLFIEELIWIDPATFPKL